MKQKDIALIIIVVAVSAIASFFISKAIFGSPNNTQQKAAVVQAIDKQFVGTDPRFFNDQAFDPTAKITIGENQNTNPFTGPSGASQ